MEREIKFRGFSKKEVVPFSQKREWVVGNLLTEEGFAAIHNGKFPVEVIPETVGQFTGLTDKNKREIYEGDIIRRQLYDFMGHKRDAEYDFGVVYYDDEVGAFGYRGFPLHNLQFFDKIGTEDIEVIANYHDNPELTKWKFKKTGKNSGSYVPPQKLLEL